MPWRGGAGCSGGCVAARQFRERLHGCLTARGDALFELADAVLCSDRPVRSLVQLSLEPEFRRAHGALYDALAAGRIDDERLFSLLTAMLPPLVDGPEARAWITEHDVIDPGALDRALSGWFSSSASISDYVLIMARTDPDAPRHRQFTTFLVELPDPGYEIVRDIPTLHEAVEPRFGDEVTGGHAEVRIKDLRIPHANVVGEVGGGFAMGQHRLGYGRLRHGMWSIAKNFIADMLSKVVDTALQIHGSLGYTFDTPLAAWYAEVRMQHLVDGPDEVHRWKIGRNVLTAQRKYGTTASAAGGDLF
jgi:hypothetical protein